MTELPKSMLLSQAEVWGAPEPFRAGKPDTLSEYVVILAGANPDGIFTEIDFDGVERSRTYGELLQDAKSLAARIEASRPPAGRFALLCYETVVDYIPAAWACLFSDFSFLPLSPSQLSRSCGEFFRRTQQTIEALGNPLVLTEARFERPLYEIDSQAPVLNTKRLLALPLVANASKVSSRAGDILIETSGTTGAPKIARLGGDKIINRLFDGVGPDRRISLNMLVPQSVGGLRLLLPLGRRTIYLHPARMMANPAIWLDCVTRFGVTDAGMSSAMAAKINETIEHGPNRWNASSLERLAFGSETITPPIIRNLIRNLQTLGMRDAATFLVYSMTETGPLFSSSLAVADLLKADAEAEGRFRLSRCADSWRLRIARENGDTASMGEIGRILVRSDTRLFRGYYPAGEGISEDGWFNTGDLGSLDEQGLLLTGREKSTISINARKICSEEVERCLSQVDGLKPGLVFAAPMRDQDNSTDELAVFFVPQASQDLAALVPRMNSAVSKALGVRISHLVPIREDDISRTATGKVKRNALAEGLRLGLLQSLKIPSTGQGKCSETLSRLTKQWREILKLEFDPGQDQSFFDLGGDSLACAQLLFAIEEEFDCRLSLEKFLEDPTLATIANLISSSTGSPSTPQIDTATNASGLMQTMQSLVRSWHGERVFSGGLLVGFNCSGCRPPMFWFLQQYVEALQLAKFLGPDQPLYAMRSCVGIIKAKDYTAEVLETVCNRYLWEMLALPLPPTFILGGNCQGGILAVAMARRLKQIGRAPLCLVLQEWSFSCEPYTEPTLLVYCEDSYTASTYQQPFSDESNWRRDFPRSRVASVPGKHGEWATREDSISCLARILSEQITSGLVPAEDRQERREWAVKLARRRAEIGELTAELAVREAAARQLQAELAIREAEAQELRAAVAIYKTDAKKLRTKIRSQSADLKNLKASRSWRITAPLRTVANALPRWRGSAKSRSDT